MTWAVYLGETPLDSIGVWVEDIAGRYHGMQRSFPTLALPGRQGVVLSADPEVAARVLTISGTIDPAARTLTARVAAEDRLKAIAYGALIKVVADDDETAPRQIDGVTEGCTVTPVVHPMVTQLSRFTLSLRCPDPTWYDVTGQVIGFGAVASPIPLGTAPSGGLVRLTAPSWSANVVTPVLRYRNAAGVLLGSMTFSTTLVAGLDYLEVDLDRQTLVVVESGVRRNGAPDLSAGDFPSLDPMDGDPLAASYPMLELGATSGTPSGQWYGSKRWL